MIVWTKAQGVSELYSCCYNFLTTPFAFRVTFWLATIKQLIVPY